MNTIDSVTAEAERSVRALAVSGTYGIEQVQPGMWVCCHPDEPERCYVVTLTGSGTECTCPDFVCTVNKIGIKCKHILAMQDKYPDEQWHKALPRQRQDLTGFTLPVITGDPFARE